MARYVYVTGGYRRREAPASSLRLTANIRARLEWRELVDKAASAAGLTEAADDREFEIQFSHLIARAEKTAPPLESASDRLIAEGLRLMCRAWRDRPVERRAGLAAALLEAARLVDALMTAEQDRESQAWRRQVGD